MKRKKFIKKLMAAGYDRNEAAALAADAVATGWSYEEAYAPYRLLFDGYLRESAEQMFEMLLRVSTGIVNGVVAFGEAYQAAMKDE